MPVEHTSQLAQWKWPAGWHTPHLPVVRLWPMSCLASKPAVLRAVTTLSNELRLRGTR
jgi:hypothetical protein